ncbi:acyl-CoA dehydrogenase/oxidase [Cokeromyces recurvatus]|uniref:acyl-CoA dehydrogenase/oxidase n=1 Tax=Cokeromyces recurvatus TaxID=90255 RepID=UPI00221FCF8C|nr:acyl-CoA dehydrogenase/oxidase [Cokeromyces recurvatus]XP_051380161.1 acyl-CoA dehydrogenase/oxidase [Cokeromyces recurvatus]KAI7899109.1 acyl-CoA dehydrogenase/oxidase [Cokeromyces recurvatus]KAI7900176.1 acyl-CoA dehydrogenase/oxidase [Cokeromyces recurvatus]
MFKLTQRLVRSPTATHLIRQATKRNYAALTFSVPTAHEAPTSLQSFTEEELMLKDTVARFAREVVQPKVRDMDEAEVMDKDIIQSMFDNGLMGLETPSEYGGAECSFTAAILTVEELAKIDPSISALCDIHNTLTNTVIRKWASPELKEKYLTRLATDTVGSFCISEAGAGSDAFALQTRAEDKGDHYVLNGGKMWISNSAEAGIFVIFANLGIRSSSTCVLNFDDVKIPKENVLGKVGEGYKYAIDSLNEGRIGIAAQMIGCAQGAYDIALPYMMERKQFGQAIGSFQAMQHQFAEVAVQIEAAKLLTYNAARLKEEGKPFVMEAAMAKWLAAKVAEKASSYAVEWMGGNGFVRETGVEKFYRDAKIGSIYEGTNNIQLQTIAKIISSKYK